MSHPILGLSSWQSAVFLINSRLGLFTAALQRGHPFSQSYGTRLQSSLTGFHSCALVYSTHPPVSVCGTGGHGKGHRLFWAPDSKDRDRIAPHPSATFSRRAFSSNANLYFNRSRCRNIDLLCIAYAFRPGLSSRLTLGRRSLPRKPWVYGGRGFHTS